MTKREVFLKKKVKQIFLHSRTFRLRKKFYNPNLFFLNKKHTYDVHSDYKNYLLTILRIKYFFGVRQRRVIKSYISSIKQKFTKAFPTLFFSLVYKRLDVILLLSGFVTTLREAHQLISHKKVFINNVVVSKVSFFLNRGDIISFDSTVSSYLKTNIFLVYFDDKLLPQYHLEISYKSLKIICLQNVININNLTVLNNVSIDLRYLIQKELDN